MAVFLSRASQQYAARVRPYTVSATIPAGVVVNSVRVRLTRESWPAGPVANITLTFPDSATCGFSVAGGEVKKRDGSVLTESSCEFSRQDEKGAPVPFPSGAYTLEFEVAQAVQTAVTVERF